MINIRERHQYIINQIKKSGSINVTELAEDLNVSSVTMRKDLSHLERKGILRRSHGKAYLATNTTIKNVTISTKELIETADKQGIAEFVAQLIEPNDNIIIGSGAAMVALAQAIKAQGKLTVITSSVTVAAILLAEPNIEVVQLGGVLNRGSNAAVGYSAENQIQNYSCSKLFISASGINIDFGISTSDIQEAQLMRTMMLSADQIIVVADASAIGTRDLGRICKLKDINHLITDSEVSSQITTTLTELGIKLTVI